MTKEEALDIIIQKYKNNVESLDDVRIAYCDEIKWDCSDCPFRHGETCESAIAEKLIERLISVEEKKETNLEHYWRTSYEVDDGESYLVSVESSKKAHDAFHLGDIKEWLLSPYEEPKPKYKLSKFEYDLLKSYGEETESTDIFCYFSLIAMREKGYFKDIHVTATFGDVLANCEVID